MALLAGRARADHSQEALMRRHHDANAVAAAACGHERCVHHSERIGAARCRECGHAFCSECIVFSFGPRQPPFCVDCALVIAGARRRGAATRYVRR